MIDSGGSEQPLASLQWRASRHLGLPILLILLGLIIQGCAAPTKAPVSSREPVSSKKSIRSANKNTAPQSIKKSTSRPALYTVKRGDTLYSISWRYSVEYRALAFWNRLKKPYTIYPGQRIRLYPPKKETPRIVKKREIPPKKVNNGSNIKKKPPEPAASKAKPRVVEKRGNQASKNKSNTSLKLIWKWPTQGVVVQRFAKGNSLRKGITISGKAGAPIHAAEAGKVVYAGSGLIGYGKLIIIKHNKNYLSAYGYNRKILVKEGMQVKRGARIALMGQDTSGRPLLHFEIRRNGAPTDPTKLLPRR